MNEIFITARGSGWDGVWNERLKSPAGFVTALKHCCAASILACHRIARHRNDAVIVQSETAEFIHQAVPQPDPETVLWNKLRFAALDLLYAHPVDSDVLLFLMDAGLTRAEYDGFMAGEPPGYQVMGNDYYGRNEKILLPDRSMCSAEDVFGWCQITKAYHDRYHKPVMHTETNHFDPDIAPAWLWKQWLNVLKIRADGVPVLGFTWYRLTDQLDWDTGLARKNGTVIRCCLYDLNRRPRPRRRRLPATARGVRPHHDRPPRRAVRRHHPPGLALGAGLRGVAAGPRSLASWSPRTGRPSGALFDPSEECPLYVQDAIEEV